MRKHWEGKATERSNFHLSTGTVDPAGTTTATGRQQEAFPACNTMDGHKLCCLYRLACAKAKLCCPSFAAPSCLMSQCGTHKLRVFWMASSAWLSPLRNRAGRTQNLEVRTQNQECTNSLASSDPLMCVYKKINKDAYSKCSNLLESKCTRGNNDRKLCLSSTTRGNAETKATSIPVQKHPPEPSTIAETNHQQAEQNV